ncbi:MAG TPA: ribose-5-phosphate isomerase RpiA [Pirellulales bacterium]|jgi:ribose 5-phosphate isomerase A|nr:ribose-5-phosphate isomerase RpiA [Pirellulales bacterium]
MTDVPHFPLDAIARRALEWVSNGAVVGLGTGHAATAFIEELAVRMRKGLRIRGIPTSQGSADLAIKLGIPLTTLEQVSAIDVDVDGADEVDPHGNLIKGYGGALVRERIVASAARRFVVLVGSEKLVTRLGSHGKLPVEVVPFGLAPCQRVLATLGFDADVRLKAGERIVTDNGNYILDCRIPQLDDPQRVEAAIRAIPGVVGTGLFLNMRPTVVIQHPGIIEVREDGQANQPGPDL